ncbi:MAG: hypothetical protein E7442_05495 [Ruminococcaceae bacterium]|nr:hypothetical protein [Oscillospiraceae bacterium]
MKKKTAALLLALVLVFGMAVGGTIAYLTSNDTVVNTFTVGSVAITLDETDVDNDDNTDDNVTVNGVVRDKENGYKLMPGHEYVKDPIVHVDAASEDCYLFVKVVDEIADIQDEQTVATQMAEKGWKAVSGVANTFVYVGTTEVPVAVKAGDDITVFDKFTIKGDVDNKTLADYENKTIKVTAYAVQADGFDGKTADYIWDTAFAGA